MTVAVTSTCTACGACIVTCPERALVPARGRPRVLDARCTSCLACVEVCPVDAITEVWGASVRGAVVPVGSR